MSAFINAVSGEIMAFWNKIIYAISGIRFFDIIDIIVVAYLLYKAFVFLRETRAGQLVKGIVVLLVVYGLANWWKLAVLQWVLSVVFNSAIIVFAIIFQPEIRRILERVGQTKLSRAKMLGEADEQELKCIETVGKAARIMQESKTGALIVFERKTQLGEIINTGTLVDAKASIPMITSLFFPNTPLHDGAVIIREGRIHAAGCILPLTQNNNISSSLGTRHRAAIGMTENSDAVVLVVSEETGNISIVVNGEISRDYDGVSATQALIELLIDSEENEQDNKIVSAIRAIIPFSKNNEKSEESEAKENEKTDS